MRSSCDSDVDPLTTSAQQSDKCNADIDRYGSANAESGTKQPNSSLDNHNPTVAPDNAIETKTSGGVLDERGATSSGSGNSSLELKGTSTTENQPHKPKWKEPLTICYKLCQSYLKVFVLFLGILSIYWGTVYKREYRFVNLKMLVVTEDNEFSVNSTTTIQPILGEAVLDMLQNNNTVNILAGWEVYPVDKFRELAAKHNNTVAQEVQRQVNHQNYWGGIHISANSTQTIYESLSTANYSLAVAGAFSTLIQVYYESGRHYSALNQYVTKNLYYAEGIWLKNYASQSVYNPLIQNYLSTDQLTTLLSNNNTLAILTNPPRFQMIDMRPPSSPAVLGPSELGLIYLMVFAFHQFNFSLEIYTYMRTRLKFRQYVVWRFVASQINCFLLSLVYCLATIAFRVPVNGTFGNSGFLVFWSFMFLYASACAAISELVATVLLALDLKLFLAPWMVFNVVINVATTFAPFELCPQFYRWGYAMPMFNTYEALKVVFFNTWKGHLGRNLGVLVIWIVVANALLLATYNWTSRLRKKKEQKELEKKS